VCNVVLVVKIMWYIIAAKHRSRSADTCTIRRPTQEAMKLVERLVDVNTREPPSEYESDVAAVRLSVATSQLENFDPVTPLLPVKQSNLHTAKGRQALRAKMNLDGLISCRPQMPTPCCGPFLSSNYADFTGKLQLFCNNFLVIAIITGEFFGNIYLVCWALYFNLLLKLRLGSVS